MNRERNDLSSCDIGLCRGIGSEISGTQPHALIAGESAKSVRVFSERPELRRIAAAGGSYREAVTLARVRAIYPAGGIATGLGTLADAGFVHLPAD